MAHNKINGKDPSDPSTTSLAWDFMIGSWARMDTLLAGTQGMRGAGTTYLPQHAEESNGNYEERLMTNVLFNATELTLDHFCDPARARAEVTRSS